MYFNTFEKFNESLTEAKNDKVYLEKNGQRIQLWSAISQGTGSTIQLTERSYITNKESDKNYDSKTEDLAASVRSQYKTIRKAQNSTMHKIPVFENLKNDKYSVWGGDAAPITYHYLIVSTGTITVIGYFNNKKEALSWISSMI